MSQQGTLEELLDALKSVDAFKVKIFNAKTPAELSAAQAGLARTTHEISQRFPRVNNDLITTFHAAYKESGGTGAVPKNFTQKSYNSRVKARNGFERSTTGLRQWGQQFAEDKQLANARKGYRDKLSRLQSSGGTPDEIKRVRASLAALPKGHGVGDNPSVFYHRRTAKGITRVEVPADVYMRMATNAAYATQRNLGVAAAAAQKSGWVIVEDGPSCGQQGHSNGPGVNGQVWDVDTALRYPISHPNCQRRFRVSPGPPNGKKTKDLLKELDLAPQKSGALNTLEKIAQAAATAGVVASVGATIVQNPFVRRFIRELIEDTSVTMPPIAQRLLTRLQSYAGNEAKAFEAHGAQLGAATQQQFDDLVANSFDDGFANEDFLTKATTDKVQLTQPQARILGLSLRPTKGELLTKLDDYGDYLLHKDALNKSVEERIQSAVNFSHANEEIHRTAALKFHLEPGEGVNLQRNWYNVIRNLKETYARNPEKADRDLVRLAAGVLDPTPWLRANLTESVRFTLGLTSRGRQNLAVKLYDLMKGGRSLSDTESTWARELGMDLTKFTEAESITVNDIVTALTPRITYQPGGLFSSTLALKGGKLQPIIRLYPSGSFGRLISLESKLRAGAVEDFVAALRKHDLPLAERWIDALSNAAQEDLITSLRLFRNSPLQLSLRMIGQYPDSWAIRALPENDYLRYSYRFNLDTHGRTAIQEEVRRRLINGESVDEILTDMTGPVKDLTEHRTKQKEARDLVRRESAKLAKQNLDDWMQGVTVLPNFGGGFSLSGLNVNQREALIKMKLLGNNLITIAKRTHYGYDQLLEMWAEFKKTVKDFTATVGSKRVLQIRSFKDATELLGDSLRDRSSIIDGLTGDFGKVDLSFAQDAATKNPALRSDLAKFRLAWESKFPQIPVPQVEVVSSLATPLSSDAGVIFIREDIATDWDVLAGLRRKAVRIGHFPRDTEATVANLIHEGAHSVMLQMTDHQIRGLMQAAIRGGGIWPIKKLESADLFFMKTWFRKDYFVKRVARAVSGYASTSTDELLAEALSEYFTSGHPRPIAKAVGDAFVATLRL